jgi:hypothetical protein
MQYHVVFDNQFSTVTSIEKETDPPAHWKGLFLENSMQITAGNLSAHLGDDWLTYEEQEVKRRDLQRETTIWDATFLQIDPKPHDARASPVEREHDPTSDPTSVNSPTSSGINVDQVETAIQAKIEPVISASTPIPPEDNSGLRRATRTTAGK